MECIVSGIYCILLAYHTSLYEYQSVKNPAIKHILWEIRKNVNYVTPGGLTLNQ